jgi:hypothetical protein
MNAYATLLISDLRLTPTLTGGTRTGSLKMVTDLDEIEPDSLDPDGLADEFLRCESLN